MLKPFSMIFFILVMVWMGGIFLTSNTQTRIERACSPVTVSDKIVVAMVQLVYEQWALDAHKMMLQMEYGCRYTVWKTFYEDVLDRSATTTPVIKESKPSAAAAPPAPASTTTATKKTAVAPADERPVEVAPQKAPGEAKPAKPLPSYMEQ